jgi:hypothetical protein
MELHDKELVKGNAATTDFFFKAKSPPYENNVWFQRDLCDNIQKNGLAVVCEPGEDRGHVMCPGLTPGSMAKPPGW